jgi:hypothetical protein
MLKLRNLVILMFILHSCKEDNCDLHSRILQYNKEDFSIFKEKLIFLRGSDIFGESVYILYDNKDSCGRYTIWYTNNQLQKIKRDPIHNGCKGKLSTSYIIKLIYSFKKLGCQHLNVDKYDNVFINPCNTPSTLLLKKAENSPSSILKNFKFVQENWYVTK